MKSQKRVKGTVTIARATAGMTKFLKLPVQSEPRPANGFHGISYSEIEKRFDRFECVDSNVKVVDVD